MIAASSTHSRLFFLAALVIALSCESPSARLDRQFDDYVKLVAALGQRDPDSLDFYAGPDEWLANARRTDASFAEIRRSAEALAVQLQQPYYAAEKESRRRLLLGQVDALVARVDILTGTKLTFDEESRRLFGVEVGNRDPAEFAAVRDELASLLPGSGSLAERYAAFDRRYVVPFGRVPDLMTRAVDECRRRTLEHLSLPAGEQVDIEYVRDMPWPAFTRYRGRGHSTTQINRDVALTVDRLLDVACHETYPGHHAINVLLDQPVQPMFSPQTLHTESAASYAVELTFPGRDRLEFERELCRAAGLPDADLERYLKVARLVDRLRWPQADIARRYLDGQLEFVRASRALEEQALMPEESSEAMLKFFNRFRTYSVTYTVGFERVREFLATSDEPSRWRAFRRWIGP
ncbi:MAG TPA: hypothetical protein VH497_02760 [Vicinamibacterales bacterium]